MDRTKPPSPPPPSSSRRRRPATTASSDDDCLLFLPVSLFLVSTALVILAPPPPLRLHLFDYYYPITLDATHLSWSEQHHFRVQEDHAVDLRSCQALIDGKVKDVAAMVSRKGVLCCDRSHRRTDVCYMRGDMRTNSTAGTIVLYGSDEPTRAEEKIRPYTRKWETPIMSTIDELTLLPARTVGGAARCDVRHNVTGIVMSSGGYTGNVYHEFNDGMLPLFVTAERFKGEVVVVVLEYHRWWFDKYGAVVRRLSNYDVVDFRRDRRVHCFPEMIIGLRIHGELSIDPRLMTTGKGINDFQAVLKQAFGAPALPSSVSNVRRRSGRPAAKPTLAIFVRHGSRTLTNLRRVVRHCQKLGFQVQLVDPKRDTPLSDIYATLGSADVMVAVHGAAVTHFLFMRPHSVLVQIVPLGLDWAADEYYGQPARRLGLHYMKYKVTAKESSLSREYDRSDPVIADPTAITQKGWAETKRIYLQHQNVTLDLKRFGKFLIRARSYVLANS